jgi:hypothetical protein
MEYKYEYYHMHEIMKRELFFDVDMSLEKCRRRRPLCTHVTYRYKYEGHVGACTFYSPLIRDTAVRYRPV